MAMAVVAAQERGIAKRRISEDAEFEVRKSVAARSMAVAQAKAAALEARHVASFSLLAVALVWR